MKAEKNIIFFERHHRRWRYGARIKNTAHLLPSHYEFQVLH